jgi:hypothetical protein
MVTVQDFEGVAVEDRDDGAEEIGKDAIGGKKENETYQEQSCHPAQLGRMKIQGHSTCSGRPGPCLGCASNDYGCLVESCLK